MKISIVGKGNVGSHLYNAFKEKFDTTLIDSRNPQNLNPSDIAIVCVKDDAIKEVVQNLKGKARIIAHTSGSLPMEILNSYSTDYGVFYPLQTFTKNVDLCYHNIPFFIEGNNQHTVEVLRELANAISGKVKECSSEERKKLHLSAVFACNFSNALFTVAHKLLDSADISFDMLLPLIKQTVDKLDKLSPEAAQTGPAVRNDSFIISRHLEMLQNEPKLAEIYRLITELIRDNSRNPVIK